MEASNNIKYTKHHVYFIRRRKVISRSIQHRSEPNGNIINLSKHLFTKGQYDLLENDLTFFPTPGHYNRSILKMDLESFVRKIKLKAFFQNKKHQLHETDLSNKEPNIKSKTKWEPKNNHHNVEAFIKAVNKDVVEIFSDKNKLPKNNLTDAYRKCYTLFFETKRSCYNDSRQQRDNCYSRCKRLYCNG